MKHPLAEKAVQGRQKRQTSVSASLKIAVKIMGKKLRSHKWLIK